VLSLCICIGICFAIGISAASDRAVARTSIVTSWVRQPAMVAMVVRRTRHGHVCAFTSNGSSSTNIDSESSTARSLPRGKENRSHSTTNV
jgi:hypothetical protein